MLDFKGSGNSRYFVLKSGKELSLYRSENLLWKKDMPSSDFEVVGVGNNGAVCIRSEDGVYYYPLFSEEPEFFIESHGREAEKKGGYIINKARMDVKGEDICVERVYFKSSISSHLRHFLTSLPVERDLNNHEIIFFNVQKGSQKLFYNYKVKSGDTGFKWDVSRSFGYVLMVESRGGKHPLTRCFIVHVPVETIYHDFDIPVAKVLNSTINDDGTSWVEFENGNDKTWLFVTIEGQEYSFKQKKSDELLYLGKMSFFYKETDKNRLVEKSFDERRSNIADLNGPEDSRLKYSIMFNERDDLDFLVIGHEGLSITHTSMEGFVVECKRWVIQANEEKAAEQERLRSEELLDRKRRESGLSSLTEAIPERAGGIVIDKNRERRSQDLARSVKEIRKHRKVEAPLINPALPREVQLKEQKLSRKPAEPTTEPEPEKVSPFKRRSEEVPEKKVEEKEDVVGEDIVEEDVEFVPTVIQDEEEDVEVRFVPVNNREQAKPAPRETGSPEKKTEIAEKKEPTRSELIMLLENLQLRYITGMVPAEEFQKVRGIIEAKLKELPAEEKTLPPPAVMPGIDKEKSGAAVAGNVPPEPKKPPTKRKIPERLFFPATKKEDAGSPKSEDVPGSAEMEDNEPSADDVLASMADFIPPSVEEIRRKVDRPFDKASDLSGVSELIDEMPPAESETDESGEIDEEDTEPGDLKKARPQLKRKEEYFLKRKDSVSPGKAKTNQGKEKMPRKDCRYVRPAKQSVEGRVVVKNRCIAFVPPLDLDEERSICADCTIPRTMQPGKCCKYIKALDMLEGDVRFFCSKTNKKYIQAERCNPEDCEMFEI
ncbi:MAG: hypothetical protein M1269_11895 [Chloroflexi bacterium]|nr:hypothetical protein [Chloroflexota bacterium]